MKKKLILVRHAHRNVIDPADDNGLSEKGKKQADAICNYFLKSFGKKSDPQLLSSPRTRCQETLAPLAKKLELESKILHLLDEGAQTKHGPLEKRIEEFLAWWRDEAPAFVMACSHGDWIPVFFGMAIREDLNLKKSGWAELELKDGKMTLKNVIQSWDLDS